MQLLINKDYLEPFLTNFIIITALDRLYVIK
jgi:hypothetical protein